MHRVGQKTVKTARRNWVKSDVKISGKTVLITGANTGLGLETAIDLAKRDGRIICACRSPEKADEAKSRIQNETKSKNVRFEKLDLASFDSIRKFAENIKSSEERLDILINNAGVMKCPQSYTQDGFEMHFGVNHLGPFLLTNLLLDMMKKNDSGRIVVLSSLAHFFGRMHWDDLNRKKDFKSMNVYNMSKLMNVHFTKELSRRLSGTGITANCVHPGIVNTNLNRHPPHGRNWSNAAVDLLFNQQWYLKTPKHGAQTSIYCAIAPELEGVTGRYFSDCHTAIESPFARSKKDALRLWEISEKITGLKTT